jgi:hypothetical protein
VTTLDLLVRDAGTAAQAGFYFEAVALYAAAFFMHDIFIDIDNAG